VRSVLSRCDVLITTGGVSMGKYDMVGAVLERVGFEPVFHKISIKPGKPLWFGMCGSTPVFALPGNPVSCLIGFEVFVRPALAKLEGEPEDTWQDTRLTGRWRGEPTKPNDRQQNLPVRVVRAPDGADDLVPLAWTSSADIVELARAQGLAVIEPGSVAQAGDVVEWRPLAQ
jgi:molybdopterin molybdotransferase